MRIVTTVPDPAQARADARVVSTLATDSTGATGGAEARPRLLLHNIELAALLIVSIAIGVGTVLTYLGQVTPLTMEIASGVQSAGADGAAARPALIDINRVRSAAELTAALEPAFAGAPDRAFAARELFKQLSSHVAQGQPLEHVGELGRAVVDPARVRATPGLRALRERAGTRQTPFAILTASQIADIKPGLIVRDLGAYRLRLLVSTALLFAGFWLVHGVRRWRGQQGDAVLLPAVFLLCGIGFLAMIALRDPLRDTTAFATFAQGVALGCVLIAAISQVDFQRSDLRNFVGIPLALALLLSVLLVLFGSGPGVSDAKVNLFGVQPVEAIRLLVVFSLAAYLAQRWELLRELSERRDRLPSWMTSGSVGRVVTSVDTWMARWIIPWTGPIRVPRLVDLRPLVTSVILIVGFFFWQRDLGPALVIGALFLTMYAVARARIVLVAIALAALVGAIWIGYQVRTPRTVAQRVDIWLSPWDNAQPGGDQVAQALWAMAAGGPWGTGPGLGDPQMIPAGHTDLVLATIGEELGWCGVLVVLCALGLIVARSLRIALRAPGDYTFFLVLGLTITLAAQALLIAAGLLGLLPLSGVVTPFLSFGRSSMLANCAAIGIVLAVGERARGPVRRPFVRPVRWVGVMLLVAASSVALRALWVQVVRGDETLTAASLTLQGDGARRYTYNPRLLAAARTIERGTIRDRHGVPLATSRAEDLRSARAMLDQLGAHVDANCPRGESRCYPLGGLTYHLLGDWKTQRAWTASNTSFVERDSDRELRGYDDGARVVEVANARTGGSTFTIRRDYRSLVPLVRHRYEPNHPSVQALRRAVHDVTTTIDARLQVRVARLLERHIRERGYSRGAVVVTDPATGAVLASVSYPWPADPGSLASPASPTSTSSMTDAGGAARPSIVRTSAGAPSPRDAAGDDDSAFLDRARYGLYPPGSTFKIVTAVAALRSDPELARREFMCQHLPDGRVGVQLRGWTRPVRDDELDREPHGNVALTRGLVVSCNAYFAQLGLQLGPQALLDAASLFQIAPATPATPAELRKALPFAAYGQGEVRATPLRMATVAGAIAADGVLRQPYWLLDDSAGLNATSVAGTANAPGAADAGRVTSARGVANAPGGADAGSVANARGGVDAGSAANARGAVDARGAVGARGAADLTAARSKGGSPAVRVIDPAHAADVAAAMRQVVTAGTGRTLAGAVVPIAGKTGTAQVDGAASHSWFIGFAPYGAGADAADASIRADGLPRSREGDPDRVSGTIAFAVILENAGYGARATPVVAEVVRAARDLGLVREPRK
jgi:cell division protein FtsW (lipid II flippase)/cell division protein FtsI/penicillin-binding protein 2